VLGDGGIYSSIDDLARWDAALYDNRLLSEESRKLAFTPATHTDNPSIDYAFGWRVTGEILWHSRTFRPGTPWGGSGMRDGGTGRKRPVASVFVRQNRIVPP
jgi:CubicO group peptidase (beta-lactamase class C family)